MKRTRIIKLVEALDNDDRLRLLLYILWQRDKTYIRTLLAPRHTGT